MRKVAWIAGFLLLAACTLNATPCVPSATTLCLNASRFEVGVAWRDSRGRTGAGQAVSITADTGYFWFFSEANIELVVKVLDARSINQKYWVFFGALSAVEYDLTVTDTATGAVKTYHNPLGQFASVGDTSAFDPAVAAPTREIVTAEGVPVPPASLEAIQGFIDDLAAQSAVAFTPCPERSFGFLLNGCRFHLAVAWKDSRGREGEGQPVQLTNDTGYFWFFSPANVELMVKVLDARAVNGQFWVFFGALSSVEFTLIVTDTLTGATKTYRNPLSNFASMGDTGAFRGGHSVQPVRDATAAVSADIGAEGGSLTATGADGSRFTLEIPDGAVMGPTTITMTPVSRIDGMPFSGGFIAGVELEPEGLALHVSGTLTIEPASPADLDRTLPYAYRGPGESFMLYPPIGASALTLPVFHFSGYGAGSGNAVDATNHAQPTGPLDTYIQEIARWKLAEMSDEITHEEFIEHLTDIANRAYDEVVELRLREARGACEHAEVKAAVQTALELGGVIQRWGGAEGLALQGIVAAIMDHCIEILRTCSQKALDRCIARNDPYEATLMIFIARQLALLGVEDPYLTTFIEGGVIESCLRFELDLESKLVDEVGASGYSYTKRYKFRAPHVPLRLEPFGNPYAHSTAWTGGCTLLPESATMEYSARPCSVECTPSRSRTEVFAMWIDGYGDFDPSNVKVYMYYDPGAPQVMSVETCPGAPPTEPTEPGLSFAEEFYELHQRELAEIYDASGYLAKDWELLRTSTGPSQNGEFFAMKSYERSRAVSPVESLTEETHLFLKHTPNAPMPSCP